MRKKINFSKILWLLIFAFILLFGIITTFDENKYNIILITIDTLRADHLPCYGYERNTSPFLCSINQKNTGSLFENIYTPTPLTLPAHISIFSGLYPDKTNIFSNRDTINKNITLITKYLKNKEYKTLGIINEIVLMELNKSFDEFYLIRDSETKISADKINEKAIDLINKNKKENFFMFLHYYQVHSPYNSTEEYRDKFYFNNKSWIKLSTYNSDIRFKGYLDNFTIEDEKHIIGQYDSNINYVDDKIKEIFENLKKEKLFKKTIVIVTSDHGENLGELKIKNSKIYGHNLALNKEETHVPLIIYHPDNIFPKKIKNVGNLADVFDLMINFIENKKDLNLKILNSKKTASRLNSISFNKELCYSKPIISFYKTSPLGYLQIYLNFEKNKKKNCIDNNCTLSYQVIKVDDNSWLNKKIKDINDSLGCDTPQLNNLKIYDDEKICFHYDKTGFIEKSVTGDYKATINETNYVVEKYYNLCNKTNYDYADNEKKEEYLEQILSLGYIN
jgi:hypothetical protein